MARFDVHVCLTFAGSIALAACLPRVEVTERADGSAGAAGSAGGTSGLACGDFDYESTSCRQKVEEQCCAEVDACRVDRDCRDHFACVFGCDPRDLSCRAECNQGPQTSEEIALTHCVATAAVPECATETVHYDRRGTTCNDCMHRTCQTELTACLAVEGCARLLSCEGTSPSGINNECVDAIPEDLVSFTVQQFKSSVDQCFDACILECNQSWGCVGQFDYPVLSPAPLHIEMQYDVSTNSGAWADITMTACGKNDAMCMVPLDVATSVMGSVHFTNLPLTSPAGFDGYFMFEGPNVADGRLYGTRPVVPGEIRSINVLDDDLPGLIALLTPGADPTLGVAVGSLGDCAGVLSSGIHIESTHGDVVYLDEGNVPQPAADATSDRGVFAITDLTTGPVTIDAFRNGQRVASKTLIAHTGMYTGLGLAPLTRTR